MNIWITLPTGVPASYPHIHRLVATTALLVFYYRTNLKAANRQSTIEQWGGYGHSATEARFDEEMKAYYQRKLKEGKPKMVIINAVRAKLINRAFATIKRGTEYVVFRHYGQTT